MNCNHRLRLVRVFRTHIVMFKRDLMISYSHTIYRKTVLFSQYKYIYASANSKKIISLLLLRLAAASFLIYQLRDMLDMVRTAVLQQPKQREGKQNKKQSLWLLNICSLLCSRMYLLKHITNYTKSKRIPVEGNIYSWKRNFVDHDRCRCRCLRNINGTQNAHLSTYSPLLL